MEEDSAEWPNSTTQVNGYRIQEEIASGAFGRVFVVEDPNTNELRACKLEKPTCQVTQIHYEYSITKYIHRKYRMNPERLQYFLKVYDFGTTATNYKYMLMELSGDDGSKLPEETTDRERVQILKELLKGIQAFHEAGFLHRDIKPTNFTLDLTRRKQVKLIDLGLAKRYMNSDGKHIDCILKKSQVGTLRYSSVYSAAHVQSSRRDDILSFIYTAVNIFCEKLPWQETPEHIQRLPTKEKKRQKHIHVYNLKRICSHQRVCKNLPRAFSLILGSAMCLRFSETPPYEKYISLLDRYSDTEYKD